MAEEKKMVKPRISTVMVHCEALSERVDFMVTEWQNLCAPYKEKYCSLRIGDVSILLDERSMGDLRGVLSEAVSRLPQGGTKPGDMWNGDEQRDNGL
jgi:hypothetical protein